MLEAVVAPWWAKKRSTQGSVRLVSPVIKVRPVSWVCTVLLVPSPSAFSGLPYNLSKAGETGFYFSYSLPGSAVTPGTPNPEVSQGNLWQGLLQFHVKMYSRE